jgi:hypothetical protein
VRLEPTEPGPDPGAAARGREADATASRPTPLTLVAGAVAGQDLRSVAATVAAALGIPVAIAIPALGAPVVAPDDALDAAATRAIADHATAVAGARGDGNLAPAPISAFVPVRIADQVVGIVAAAGDGAAGDGAAGDGDGDGESALSGGERRAWLEAAAAAASVTALIADAHGGGAPGGDAGDLLAELAAGEPADLGSLLTRARRLGVELGGGAIAIAARREPGDGPPAETTLRDLPALVACRDPGRLLTLVPLAGGATEAAATAAERLRAEGWAVSCSAPRRHPGQLHLAVVEAELLGELRDGVAAPDERQDTYRLLIGVLLRDREELQALCAGTISPLADYDARHDTELLATLHAFLRHDGSTTETAEAMHLHRHTVGYRLSRVHEVSGLSPYASDGRERLSLGIKARQILEAERRRGQSPPDR